VVSVTEGPSENRASRTVRQSPARRIAAGLALAALVLVGAETAVRIDDWAQFRTPLLFGATAVTDLLVVDAAGTHPAPNTSFRKWRINSLGTRGPEPDSTRRASRVLILGASETFGIYESPDHEYARQLADSLDAGRCHADVLNAGFPGMSLPTVDQDLRLRLAAIHSQVAVYYPTPAQYLDASPPHPSRRDTTGDGRPHLPLWSTTFPWGSRFLARASGQFKLMLPRQLQDYMRNVDLQHSQAAWPGDSLFERAPGDRIDRFDADLRTLVGTTRQLHITPVLVTHANAFTGTPPAADDRLRAWQRFYPRAVGRTLVAFDSVAADRIQRVAGDSAVAVVDAWRAFHDVPSDSMFADFSHFTDAGAARMAAILTPVVRRSLGCTP